MDRFPERTSVAALLFLALGLALAAPVLGDPTRYAIGHPETDTYNHLWGYWWVAERLLQGRSPFQVEGLGWPQGGQLYFIDLFGAVLTLPVSVLGGPVLAYNAAIVLNVALAGMGAFALARRVGLAPPAALFAGLVYATTPHLLGQLYDGISETAAIGWLPLAIAGALAWRDDPRPRTGAVAGLLLGVAALASFYYGLFSALAVFALLLSRTVDRPRAWLRPLAWRSVLAFTASLLAVAGPALLAFRSTLVAEDALVTREEGFVSLALFGHNMTDLLSFFRPGRVYSPDLRVLYDEALIVVVYVGWVPLLAGAAALARASRRPAELPRLRPWLAGALLSFTLALGPFLYVRGGYASLPGDAPVPLPFLAFFSFLPGFSRISHAFRFAVPLGLCLALLAATWVHTRRRPGRAALGFGALWLLELALLSPAVLPLPVSDAATPAAYAAIPAAHAGPSHARPPESHTPAVLDLPVSLQVLARSRYAWWQAWHGLAIPYGLNDPTPRVLAGNRLGQALINAERSSLDTLPAELPTLDLVLGARALAAEGLNAIVVHRALYPPAIRDKILLILDVAVGGGARVGDADVYLLSEPLARRSAP